MLMMLKTATIPSTEFMMSTHRRADPPFYGLLPELYAHRIFLSAFLCSPPERLSHSMLLSRWMIYEQFTDPYIAKALKKKIFDSANCYRGTELNVTSDVRMDNSFYQFVQGGGRSSGIHQILIRAGDPVCYICLKWPSK